MEEVKLAPSEDGQPPIIIQYDTSPDPHVSVMGTLEKEVDQAGSQDPSPQGSPQLRGTDQGASNVGGSNILLGLSFPRKLWRIVEDDAFTSVHWNEAGDTVIIKKDLFQSEILCRRGEDQVFKSDSLKTFIHLLNLHEFNKIHPGDSSVCSPGKMTMIYGNNNFQRGKPWLLENIKTKGNRMTCASPGSRATPPKRKKEMAPTSCCPRIHHETDDEEDEQKAERNAGKALGPSAIEFFTYLRLRPTRSAMEGQGPSEAGVPSGEGTSRKGMFVPSATAGTTGTTGDLPTRPPKDPLHGSMMYLSNPCHSTRRAGSSIMAPLIRRRRRREGSSDNKRSLCEQFKGNTGP